MKRKLSIILMSIAIMLSFTPLTFAETTQDNLLISFIDVGAGDSTYIEMPDGTDILIDGGTPSKGKQVVSYLKSLEEDIDIEYLISTHPDFDHVGGLKAVFKGLEVKNFYYPKDESYTKTKTAKEILKLAKKEEGCNVYNAKPGTTIECGDATLTFIHGKKNYSSSNDDSVMSWINYKDFNCLIAGDVAGSAQLAGEKVNVDVLLAPHHGSKLASSIKFIKKYDPEYVVFSADGKKYGHPEAETINRYLSYDENIEYFRTDKDGTITLIANGTSYVFDKTSHDIKDAPKVNKEKVDKVDKTKVVTPVEPVVNTKNVYITSTGKKYHLDKDCRGLSNSNSITKISLKDAKSRGYTLCGFED